MELLRVPWCWTWLYVQGLRTIHTIVSVHYSAGIHRKLEVSMPVVLKLSRVCLQRHKGRHVPQKLYIASCSTAWNIKNTKIPGEEVNTPGPRANWPLLLSCQNGRVSRSNSPTAATMYRPRVVTWAQIKDKCKYHPHTSRGLCFPISTHCDCHNVT